MFSEDALFASVILNQKRIAHAQSASAYFLTISFISQVSALSPHIYHILFSQAPSHLQLLQAVGHDQPLPRLSPVTLWSSPPLLMLTTTTSLLRP